MFSSGSSRLPLELSGIFGLSSGSKGTLRKAFWFDLKK
jgi:hypothetical protein